MPSTTQKRIQAFHSGIGDFNDLHLSIHNQDTMQVTANLYARGLTKSNHTIVPLQHISYELKASGKYSLKNDNQWIEYRVRKHLYLQPKLNVSVTLEIPGPPWVSELVETSQQVEKTDGTFKISDYGTQPGTANLWYRGYTFEVTKDTKVNDLIGGGTEGRFTVVIYEAIENSEGEPTATTLLGHTHVIGTTPNQQGPIIPASGSQVILKPNRLYLLAQARTDENDGNHHYVSELDIEHLQTHPRIKAGSWKPISNHSFRWEGDASDQHHIAGQQYYDYHPNMPMIGFTFDSDVDLPEVQTLEAEITDTHLILKGNLTSTGGDEVGLYFNYGSTPDVFEEGLVVQATPGTSTTPTEFSWSLPIPSTQETIYYRAFAINEAGRVLGHLYKVESNNKATVFSGSGIIEIDEDPLTGQPLSSLHETVEINPLELLTLTTSEGEVFRFNPELDDEGNIIEEATLDFDDPDAISSIECYMTFSNQGDGNALFQQAESNTSTIVGDIIQVNLSIEEQTYENSNVIRVDNINYGTDIIRDMPTFSKSGSGFYILEKVNGIGLSQARFQSSSIDTSSGIPPETTNPSDKIVLFLTEEQTEEFTWTSQTIGGTITVNENNKEESATISVPASQLGIPSHLTGVTITLTKTGYSSIDGAGDPSKASLVFASGGTTLSFASGAIANQQTLQIRASSSYKTTGESHSLGEVLLGTITKLVKYGEEVEFHRFSVNSYNNVFDSDPDFFFFNSTPYVHLRLDREGNDYVLYAYYGENTSHAWHPSAHHGYYYLNQDEHFFYTKPIELIKQATTNKRIVLPSYPQQGNPILVEKNGKSYRRVFFADEEERPSLIHKMQVAGNGTHRLYLDHDDVTQVKVSKDGSSVSNFTIQEHWLEFSSPCVGLFTIEYVLNHSYLLLEEEGQVFLEFFEDESSINITYESSPDTSYRAIPSIALNNMHSPINQGFIYLTDQSMPVHSIQLQVSPKDVSLDYNHPVRFIAQALDKNNNPVPGVQISCTDGDRAITRTTDQYGYVSGTFDSFASRGVHTIRAYHDNNEAEETIVIF